jgi:tetratricopeptide (TPR) repeat protein
MLNALGRFDEALPCLAQAIALAERCGDVREQAESLRQRAWAHRHLSRPADALADLRAALALIPRHRDPDVARWTWRDYFQVASKVPAEDIAEQLAAALAWDGESDAGWLGWCGLTSWPAPPGPTPGRP